MFKLLRIASFTILSTYSFAQAPILKGVYESGCEFVKGHNGPNNSHKTKWVFNDKTTLAEFSETFYQDSKCQIMSTTETTWKVHFEVGSQIENISYGKDGNLKSYLMRFYELKNEGELSLCFFIDPHGFNDGESMHLGNLENNQCNIKTTWFHSEE